MTATRILIDSLIFACTSDFSVTANALSERGFGYGCICVLSVVSCCLLCCTMAQRDELGTRQYLKVHYLSAQTVVGRDALLPRGYRLDSALW